MAGQPVTGARVLRFVAPLAFGVLLLVGPHVPPSHMSLSILAVRGTGIVWLLFAVAALIRWPWLWTLVPNIVLVRVGMSFGMVNWSDFVDGGAVPLAVAPLLLVVVTTLVRRRPAASPGGRGRLAPNAEGVGALLVLALVAPLALTGRHGLEVAVLLAAAAAGLLVANQIGQSRPHRVMWVAVIVGTLLSMAYALYWARPDWAYGRVVATQTGTVAAVTLWAGLRAVVVPAAAPSLVRGELA